MSTAARVCRCGKELWVQTIVTDLSPQGVAVGLCVDCDRPRCGKCNQTFGGFCGTLPNHCDCGR